MAYFYIYSIMFVFWFIFVRGALMTSLLIFLLLFRQQIQFDVDFFMENQK